MAVDINIQFHSGFNFFEISFGEWSMKDVKKRRLDWQHRQKANFYGDERFMLDEIKKSRRNTRRKRRKMAEHKPIERE